MHCKHCLYSVEVFVSEAVVHLVWWLLLAGRVASELVVKVVVAVAHPAAPKQRRCHDTLVSSELAHLALQLDQSLLLALQLARARHIAHFVVEGVLHAIQFVCCLLLIVVELLHRVNYLPELDGQLLFPQRYTVQFTDLLLIFSVHALLVLADLVQLRVQRLAYALKYLSHVRVYVRLDVSAHLLDQVVVPAEFFDLFGQVAPLTHHQLNILFDGL